MKDNIIEFLYPKKTKNILQEIFPVRTIQNIPEWYKNLNHSAKRRTIKGCIPFLDTLTAGYILKMPQDFYVKHNHVQGDRKDSSRNFAYADCWAYLNDLDLNLNDNTENLHGIGQLGGKEGGCPFVEKNKNLPFYKIQNPFRIKTPPGYSCLFVPPLNNGDDRFEIISGIVDTDTFTSYINFPIILNGDKYPVLETIIERGTPYVQVIPFKRDSWKMSIKEDYLSRPEAQLSISGRLIHNYKKLFWGKKSWR
jgi:hypothetical protein|tara:strand:- start:1909 stop:2664 length:756 start_codon:yes stop_codon:yes gene_type:complete